MNTPRNPIIAFIISLFVPGLGQLYNGKLAKALTLLAITLLIPILFSYFGNNKTFIGYVLFGLTLIVFRLYIVVDASISAKRLKLYQIKKENKWYSYTIFILLFILILNFYDLYKIIGVETFTIPSTGNSPSLIQGDYVVADLDAYKNKKPKAGDLIVFIGNDGMKYTYRIVGEPNDTIEMKNNILFVNNTMLKKTKYGESSFDNMKVKLYDEKTTNGYEYSICNFFEPYPHIERNLDKFEVPENNYFVLGDNRDNAADSRVIGFVQKENIKGKIIFVLWDKQLRRLGQNVR
jgi:signal peptidase I